MKDMNTYLKVMGATFGFVFALIAFAVGLWQAIVMIVCGLIGFLAIKFWLGEIDFIEWYEEFLKRRGKR